MSYFSQLTQNVTTDATNSSTTNLTGSETFTGGTTSTLGVAGIQVNLFTSNDCVLYVDQSIDGTNWDITDSYNFSPGKGATALTVQATASYFRIRVTNSDTTTTSYFRLQTNLCPIIESLPRSLDDEGYLKIGIKSIRGDMGRVRVSPGGALRTSETVRLAGAAIAGSTVDTSFWANTVVGTGATSTANGEMTLTTGATANSSVLQNSVRIGRFVPGTTNFYRAQFQCPANTTTTGNTIRRWGAFDANDGYFFELTQANGTATTVLGIVSRKGGVDTKVSNGSFNGYHGSSHTIDTNLHTYEIWMGLKTVYFYYDDVLLHTLSFAITTGTATPHLKIGTQVLNQNGNTAANTIVFRAAMINRMGKVETVPVWRNVVGALGATILKQGPGRLSKVILNKTTGTSISIYDALSATNPIAVITPPGNNAGPTTITYDIEFYTGLTIVTVGATVDCTITWE